MTEQDWKDEEARRALYDRLDRDESVARQRRQRKNRLARERRRTMKEAYESVGMVKVRGALGGVYWE